MQGELEKKIITLRVNMDIVKERGNLGVRRAAVFMGLGLHAANREDFRDYELNKLPVKDGEFGIPVDVVPSNAPKEIVDKFKTEFGAWVTGCGLREMLEHYALAVDDIHNAGLLLLHLKAKTVTAKEGNELQENFRKISGLPKKLRVLEKRCGIAPKHQEHIESLYRARNCLTHGAGLVTSSYTNDKDALTLKWRALEVFTTDPKTGNELVGRQIIGTHFPEGGEILGRTVERRKTFKVGQKVNLTQQDLWEICHFFAMECIPSLLDSTLAFCEKHGVKVNRLPEPKKEEREAAWAASREREARVDMPAEAKGETLPARASIPTWLWVVGAGIVFAAFSLGYCVAVA